MIKYLDKLKKEDVADKKVMLRTDFDVAFQNGKVVEDYRIRSHKETLDYLLANDAKVLLVSHLGHDDPSATFLPVAEQIGEILGQTLTLVPHSELASVDLLFEKCPVLLLDNIRQDPGEVKNDEQLARRLAKDFDYYVNDAFAVCHRKHASIVAIVRQLPSYAGLLIKKEVKNLANVIKSAEEGKIMVIGGAKISTKLPVIKNFLDKAEKILVGGALANNFFKAKGINVGLSRVDDNLGGIEDILEDEKILLPQDFLTGEGNDGLVLSKIYKDISDVKPSEAILDIGYETEKRWSGIIEKAKVVIWNGPVGQFELKDFSGGTEKIAQAVVKSLFSVIGGGDTIAAMDKFGLLGKVNFVSTGGGAMLDFLAGERLPGLEALEYYNK